MIQYSLVNSCWDLPLFLGIFILHLTFHTSHSENPVAAAAGAWVVAAWLRLLSLSLVWRMWSLVPFSRYLNEAFNTFIREEISRAPV